MLEYTYTSMYLHIRTLCAESGTHAQQSFPGSSISVLGTPGCSLNGWHRGHRWGQRTGLMHRPLCRTKSVGQWQPATHGLLQGPISFQVSQVFTHPGPQVSYTAPCLHWVAAERRQSGIWGVAPRFSLSLGPCLQVGTPHGPFHSTQVYPTLRSAF